MALRRCLQLRRCAPWWSSLMNSRSWHCSGSMGHVRCADLGGRVVQKYFAFTQTQGIRNTATREWGTDVTTLLAVLVGEAIASFQRTILKYADRWTITLR
jgi:hypothetical protein